MKIENSIITDSQTAGVKPSELDSSRDEMTTEKVHSVKKIALNDNAAKPNVGQQQNLPREDAALDDQKFEQLSSLVDSLNKSAQKVERSLVFKVDDETRRPIVTVTDRESGKVIRQIPSEEALALSEKLEEFQSLMLEIRA